MRYIRSALRVEAIRLKEAMTLSQDPSFGRASGVIGDWLITEANGTQYIVSNNQFNAWFVPDDADKLPAPTVTCDQTSPTTTRRPTWRWNIVTDAAGYRYRLDGGNWAYITNAGFREFTPNYDLPLGNHTLDVQAIDSWDLPGDTGSLTVEIVAP